MGGRSRGRRAGSRRTSPGTIGAATVSTTTGEAPPTPSDPPTQTRRSTRIRGKKTTATTTAATRSRGGTRSSARRRKREETDSDTENSEGEGVEEEEEEEERESNYDEESGTKSDDEEDESDKSSGPQKSSLRKRKLESTDDIASEDSRKNPPNEESEEDADGAPPPKRLMRTRQQDDVPSESTDSALSRKDGEADDVAKDDNTNLSDDRKVDETDDAIRRRPDMGVSTAASSTGARMETDKDESGADPPAKRTKRRRQEAATDSTDSNDAIAAQPVDDGNDHVAPANSEVKAEGSSQVAGKVEGDNKSKQEHAKTTSNEADVDRDGRSVERAAIDNVVLPRKDNEGPATTDARSGEETDKERGDKDQNDSSATKGASESDIKPLVEEAMSRSEEAQIKAGDSNDSSTKPISGLVADAFSERDGVIVIEDDVKKSEAGDVVTGHDNSTHGTIKTVPDSKAESSAKEEQTTAERSTNEMNAGSPTTTTVEGIRTSRGKDNVAANIAEGHSASCSSSNKDILKIETTHDALEKNAETQEIESRIETVAATPQDSVMNEQGIGVNEEASQDSNHQLSIPAPESGGNLETSLRMEVVAKMEHSGVSVEIGNGHDANNEDRRDRENQVSALIKEASDATRTASRKENDKGVAAMSVNGKQDNGNKRTLDDEEFKGAVSALPTAEVDSPKSDRPEAVSHDKQISLNVDRIKVVLFSVGKRVHRSRGYERLFSEYWKALSMYLEGRQSHPSATNCKAMISRFLKTKTMQKLHNRLIMGECRAQERGTRLPLSK